MMQLPLRESSIRIIKHVNTDRTGLSNKDNSLNASFENYKEEDMEEIANSAVAEYKL